MSDFPLVSVLIITYNQIDFLEEALSSALEQDYVNIEIVVADDGSTDGTAETILGFAREYSGKIVPLVGGPNLGITGNSNRGLRACKGKYIAFMGGDDLFLQGKISRQVEWLEADEMRVLCGHQVEVFYEDGRPSHPLTRHLKRGRGPQKFIRHGTLFGATSVMVRASSTPKGGFDPSLSLVSDGLFFTETLMGGGEYGYISGVYAKYRRHSNNITNQGEKCLNDLSQFYRIVRKRYPQYKKDADVGEAKVIHYARGFRYFQERDAKKSIPLFWKGIIKNPLGSKLWVRLIQAIFMLAFCVKSK